MQENIRTSNSRFLTFFWGVLVYYHREGFKVRSKCFWVEIGPNHHLRY